MKQEIQQTETIIELKDVSFYREKKLIFEDLTFSIHRGELIAIMGPSGTGKTTLMQLITGQLKPTTGSIYVLGENIQSLSPRALLALRRRMSMMFQNNALFTDLTVAENVAFPLKEQSALPPSIIHILVTLKLQRVGLLAAADLLPNALSGGMARRAALARAIALDPEIIIYDEPFTGQDPVSLGLLLKLLRDLNRGLNMTSLIVSHDVAEVCQIADRILFLMQGRLWAQGTPEALRQHTHPEIHAFMHGEALPNPKNQNLYWQQLESSCSSKL